MAGPIFRDVFVRVGGPSKDHARTAHGEALAKQRRTRVQVPAAPLLAFPLVVNDRGFCFIRAGHPGFSAVRITDRRGLISTHIGRNLDTMAATVSGRGVEMLCDFYK